MLKELKRISIFLSSPGDCVNERLLAKRVVEQINADHGFREGFVVDLLMWETHSAPGTASYSQDVINRDIGRDFQIFLGFFRSRFGSETKAYKSGTEEEYRRAREHGENGNPIEFMWYFCDGSFKLDEIDLSQLSLINDFKEKLRSEGVLYWKYRDETSLTLLLHSHLYKRIRGVLANEEITKLRETEGRSHSGKVSVDQRLFSNFAKLLVEDPAAAADVYVRRSSESMNGFSDAISEMARRQKQMNQKIDRETKKLSGVVNTNKPDARLLSIVNELQQYIYNAAKFFQSKSKAAQEFVRESVSDMSRAVLIYNSIGGVTENDLRFVSDSILNLEKTLSGTIEQLREASGAMLRLGKMNDGILTQARVYSAILVDMMYVFEGVVETLGNMRNSHFAE